MTRAALPLAAVSAPSPVATLLRKEFRLLADGVVPALAILVAFVVVGLLVVAAPRDWRPEVIRDLRVAEFLAIVAAALGLGSPILAGWWTAAIVSGDRRHGARSLAEALPASRSARLLARSCALLVAVVGPALLSWLVLRLAFVADPQVSFAGLLRVPFWMAVALGAAAVATVGLAADRVRSMLAAQLAGHLSLLVGCLAVFVVAWLAFAATGAEILRVGRLGGERASLVAEAIRLESSAIGALIGSAAGVAIVAAAFVAAILRARSTRWMRGALVLAILGAMLTAIVAGRAAASRSETLAAWDLWRRRATIGASDEEVARGVRNVVAAMGSGIVGKEEDWALWYEGVARLATAGSRADAHPLWQVFLELEPTAQGRVAIWTTRWRPIDHPAYEPALVDALLRDPGNLDVVRDVWRTLWSRHPGFRPRLPAERPPTHPEPLGLAQFLASGYGDHSIGHDRRRLAVERLREAWPTLDWSSLPPTIPTEHPPE